MFVPFRQPTSHTQAYAVQSAGHLPAPQPTIAYAHSGPVEDGAVLSAPEATIAPSPAIHYSIQPQAIAYAQPSPSPSPAYGVPHQVHIQSPIDYSFGHQAIQYLQPPKHAQQYTQSYRGPSVDVFGPYNKAASLLDSYVPSSVIYARQQAFQRQVLQPINHGSHAPGYNTIAYSTPQSSYAFSAYAKRSTKPGAAVVAAAAAAAKKN